MTSGRKQRARRSTVLIVAITAVVGGGCAAGGDDGQTAHTTDATPISMTPVSPPCEAVVDIAANFFEEHSGGPGSLNEIERSELMDRINDVEARCDEVEVAKFGTEHLEPWSGTPSEVDGPVTTGAP